MMVHGRLEELRFDLILCECAMHNKNNQSVSQQSVPIEFQAMSVILPDFAPGSVWLVGAGPGDPGLLTLLGAHAVRTADIVLYDALLNTDILALMGPHGRAISVGRRKGAVTATVAQTIDLMLRHAAAGRRVVRLKGGDPFVFGRGGEEAEALAGAGVAFRIVPGITAGIGGLAYAGVAVTKRRVNAAVTLLTGHDENGRLPESVDWASAARDDQILVVYMGLTALDDIAQILLAHGRDHRTPVAVVSNASTPQQRVFLTTLGECVLAVRRARMPSPAILVIGEAAAPDAIFPWYDPAETQSTAEPLAADAARDAR
jgi:uroporphyrin-III C-methyltransferase